VLKRYGVPAFNEVLLKPEGRELVTVMRRPLVAVGRFGEGRTVAFTGFTPIHVALPPHAKPADPLPYLVDQQLFDQPSTEAWLELFALLLTEASGVSHGIDCGQLFALRKEPLFE